MRGETASPAPRIRTGKGRGAQRQASCVCTRRGHLERARTDLAHESATRTARCGAEPFFGDLSDASERVPAGATPKDVIESLYSAPENVKTTITEGGNTTITAGKVCELRGIFQEVRNEGYQDGGCSIFYAAEESPTGIQFGSTILRVGSKIPGLPSFPMSVKVSPTLF